MPNRVLRESILDSDPVNSLGWPEEVFYRRLMSVVDDFGRYDARPAVLRSRLYPLKLEQVREADVSRWLAECEKAGLVRLYSDNGKPYLLFEKFKQHVRAETSKYPAPLPVDAEHTQCSRTAHAPHPRSESETYSETETKARESAGLNTRWKTFWDEYPKKAKREEAYRAFRDIDPDDALAAHMVHAVRVMKQSTGWQEKGGIYVPKAVDWLTDGRWQEVKPAKSDKPKPPSRAVVADLLKRGKKVPDEFLALYPDLVARSEQ